MVAGKKLAYRLFDSKGQALLDYLAGPNEPPPEAGKQLLCRHPFESMKRVYVTPHRVEPLHTLVYDSARKHVPEDVDACRKRLQEQFDTLREDYSRALNPTPYKVSVSEELYTFLHRLIESEAPIKVIQ